MTAMSSVVLCIKEVMVFPICDMESLLHDAIGVVRESARRVSYSPLSRAGFCFRNEKLIF